MTAIAVPSCSGLKQSPLPTFATAYKDCFTTAGFSLPASLKHFVKERSLLGICDVSDEAWLEDFLLTIRTGFENGDQNAILAQSNEFWVKRKAASDKPKTRVASFTESSGCPSFYTGSDFSTNFGYNRPYQTMRYAKPGMMTLFTAC